jgi:hypothetical protein
VIQKSGAAVGGLVCLAYGLLVQHTAIQLRLSPEQSGKVEYERERLLGIANKFIHL